MEIFADYTFRTVALDAAGNDVIFPVIISGVLGCYAVLQKQGLLGDGISHAALAGVAAAFLATGSKSTAVLLAGALVSGLAAVFLITKAVGKTKLKYDAALASVMSVMFGLGTVLLTVARKLPDANQAGLDRFIYGQAGAISEKDVIFIGVCGIVMLACVVLLRKEFKAFVFDRSFAAQLGFHGGFVGTLLSLLIVTAVIIGLQTVGVVLMSAMIITPAAAARQWTDRLWVMVVISAATGGFGGCAGVYFSSSTENLPTGPAIVLTVTAAALFSLLFAPRRGIISRIAARRRSGGENERRD